MSSMLGALMALALAGEASAAPDPIDIQGLQLADGSMMPRVPTEVWGHTAVPSHPGLDALNQDIGRVWVDWDAARGHVRGIMTSGVPAPGTVDNPSLAEAVAHDFIARHLDVLAPGTTMGDFVMVANHESSGIRSVGFAQVSNGRPVIGGQVSVRFKVDRLVYAASQALPYVEAPMADAPLASAVAFETARSWVEGDFAGLTASASNLEGPFILPLWDGIGFNYAEVVRVTVSAHDHLAQWTVYLDATTGAPVAREQRMHSAVTVHYNVPERQPQTGYVELPATDMQVFENGMGSLTDQNGEVAVNNDPTALTTTVTGPLVNVNNHVGASATANFPVADGETLVWDGSGDQLLDAQLSAFVHTAGTKDYIRAIDPALGWLDDTIQVTVNQINVNLGSQCNAASNGDSIFFLQAGNTCENTARLADVVRHEMGHSVHSQSIIPGVGTFEGALSEGISDYLAATMGNDSGMGRGFFYDNQPLRELDPDGFEWTWPQDKGGVHDEGRIIGGTLWDLREALRATLGDDPGRIQTDLIYYEGHRRAVDIPSMYPEALVIDDDDGNLANGTPNICEINAAFGAHGLYDPGEAGGFDVAFTQEIEGGEVVVISTLPENAACPITLDSATLRWRERGEMTGGDEIDMVLQDGAWVATIPPQDTGVVVEYQVDLVYSSGELNTYPRNAADPWYQAFFGAADPIYCLDANADQGEWVFAGAGSQWSFGPLVSGDNDPEQPYDDDDVLLQQNGNYPAGANTSATSPEIDLTGYEDVRLHYRRWLTVEDSVFDQARIRVNGQTRWVNLFGTGNTHHIDREWRFQDLPLNDFLDGTVELQFQLASDGGLELGGWTMDALCVVEVVESVCGDGQVTGEELCDDSNTEDGDGCDSQCNTEEPDPGTTGGEDTTGGNDDGTGDSGGDDVVDTGGPITSAGPTSGDGDDDSTGSGDPSAEDGGDGCGCVAGSGGGPLSGGWLLLLVAGVLRRRRG